MEADPMVDQSLFKDLRPVPGDPITIDGNQASFEPISAKVGNRKGGAGGLTMTAGLQPGKWPNRGLTVIGYTVLDVKEFGFYKVAAGFSQAVRVQLLNGSASTTSRSCPSKGTLSLGAWYSVQAPAGVTSSLFWWSPPMTRLLRPRPARPKRQPLRRSSERFANGPLDPSTLIVDYDQVLRPNGITTFGWRIVNKLRPGYGTKTSNGYGGKRPRPINPYSSQ